MYTTRRTLNSLHVHIKLNVIAGILQVSHARTKEALRSISVYKVEISAVQTTRKRAYIERRKGGERELGNRSGTGRGKNFNNKK